MSTEGQKEAGFLKDSPHLGSQLSLHISPAFGTWIVVVVVETWDFLHQHLF